MSHQAKYLSDVSDLVLDDILAFAESELHSELFESHSTQDQREQAMRRLVISAVTRAAENSESDSIDEEMCDALSGVEDW